MAWRGVGTDDDIWTARSSDGVRWTPQRKVPGVASADGPTLAWKAASCGWGCEEYRVTTACTGQPAPTLGTAGVAFRQFRALDLWPGLR